MISAIIFLVVALAPIALYLINAGLSMRDNRGIAAGIPKPKEAKPPRAARSKRSTAARVSNPRVQYCGRGFTHFALAVLGSQDACRHCEYLEAQPQDPTPIRREVLPDERTTQESDDDREAAVRAAEEILEQNSHN